MHPEPTLDSVLQALHLLYHSPDTAQKDHASVWLQEFQKSVYAWTISDQLLAHKKDLESCYFGAQTMRTKIQFSFYELPVSSHVSLRDSLLNHINQCDSSTNNVVVTQLCLALVDLALLMGTWKNSAQDLLQKFGPNPQSYPVLLAILALYPEEISSSSLKLGKNRREELKAELRDSFDATHQFLLACMTQHINHPKNCRDILKCLGSWFRCGAVTEKSILKSELLRAIFHFLSDTNSSSELHEAASDCLVEMLCKCEDLRNYGYLAQCLFEQVLSLHQPYTVCAAQSDTDRCLNYARIFTDMSESFIESMIQCPNEGLGSFNQLETVCSTLNYEEYEVAEISFNFWYNLTERLYQIDEVQLNAMFSPYVQKCIVALHKHIQMAPDHEGLLERSDEFYDFRVRASELIKDMVFVVSSTSCFTEMCQVLNSTPVSSWQIIEAALFVLAALARNIVPDKDGMVPLVLDAIFNQYCNPPRKTHISIDYTSLILFGELAEWFENHVDRLGPVLQFILTSLLDDKLVNVAASSLEQICVQCAGQDSMKQNIGVLLDVVRGVDTFTISTDATIRLIKGVSAVMAKFSVEHLADGIRQLCSFQLEPIKMLISKPDPTLSKITSKKNDPGHWVDRLTTVIRYGVPEMKNEQHPCYPVIAEMWPAISQLCDKYQDNVKLIEKCCRCIRFAIRNLGLSFTPLLLPLVTQMMGLYSSHHHSCYLYLGSILVDEYGSEPGCVQGLLDMTRALAKPTLELLGGADGLRCHPDTVDDFFRLNMRFLQRDRTLLLGSGVARPLIKCAIASTVLEHREANASVMKFIIEFLNVPGTGKSLAGNDITKHKQVADLLSEEGQALMDSLVHCCVSVLPAYMMTDIAEVTLCLLKFDKTSTSHWLQHSLSNLPTQSAGGVVTATTQQITDFHSGVVKSSYVNRLEHLYRDFLVLYR